MKKSRVDRERFRAAYEQGKSWLELAEEFGITDRYARVLRDRMKLPLRNVPGETRPVPEDFVAVVEKIGISKARKHFTASWETVAKWADMIGMERKHHKPGARPWGDGSRIKVPEDFAELAPTMFKKELARHYNCSVNRIRRICEMTGLKTKPTVHDLAKINGPKRRGKTGNPRGRNVGGFKLTNLSSPIPSNDNFDKYGQAARFLRRTFTNVFRCDIKLYENRPATFGDERDPPLPKGGAEHYFVAGLGVVHRENLLSIAEQKGFVPDTFEADAQVA